MELFDVTLNSPLHGCRTDCQKSKKRAVVGWYLMQPETTPAEWMRCIDVTEREYLPIMDTDPPPPYHA